MALGRRLPVNPRCGNNGLFFILSAMNKVIGSISSALTLSLVVFLSGCAGINDSYDPYYGGYGSNDPYYGNRPPPPPPPYGGYDNGYNGYNGGYYSGQDRRERERLEDERRRLERERIRLEDERRRQDTYRPPPPPPPRPDQDRCPPGFSPSENKCSREERRRGCQDIRMPSGLGCVKR